MFNCQTSPRIVPDCKRVFLLPMLNQLPLYFLAIFALLPLSCHAVDSQTYGMYPDWSKNVGIYKVNVRQFSEEGTFGEVTEYLPKIKAMGIDLVWLMPIYEIGEKNRKGSLGSYYSIQDYKSVNPEFGNEEAGLDKQLLFFEKDLIDWRPHPEREQLTRLFHWKKPIKHFGMACMVETSSTLRPEPKVRSGPSTARRMATKSCRS